MKRRLFAIGLLGCVVALLVATHCASRSPFDEAFAEEPLRIAPPEQALTFARTGGTHLLVQQAGEAGVRGVRLDGEDFERLVATTPDDVTPPPSTWWRELLILGVWTLGLVVASIVLSRRS